jgi:hypothetical protein
MHTGFRWLAALGLVSVLSAQAAADFTFFSTNPTPNGAMAMASRPESAGKIEIEAADDFFNAPPVQISSATFTGLLVPTSPTGPTPAISQVVAELYHIFPIDSDVTRTSQVPTRVNSPSDVEFDSRASASNTLTFTTSILSSPFTAANSVLNGIHLPNVPPGGDGPVTGTEVQFNLKFTTPFTLPAGSHDFFVPQVQVDGGEFYWLSSARPIVPPGTPFPAGTTDLQAWIRNADLAPDWLRVGQDIVGGSPFPTFNGTFTLSTVPEPSSWVMAGTAALIGLGCALLRKRTIATTARA